MKPLLARTRAFLAHLARDRRPFSAATAIQSTTTPTALPAADFETDVLVIGAGVVGLAVARAAALRGASVVVAERGAAFGTGTSSRSSEVVHAGLYYPPGSLKAVLCARGRDMLYDYCAERGVAHKVLGKLVVASGENGPQRLGALARNADAASAAAGSAPLDLRLLTGAQARELEPELGPGVDRALLSPRTGIVDSHGLMAALLTDAEANGAVLALRSAAVPMPAPALAPPSSPPRSLSSPSSSPSPSSPSPRRRLTVAIRDAAGETSVFAARRVFNCAGLGAEACARGALAHLNGGSAAAAAPALRFAKGNYFELAAPARAPFSRLVYPLPEDGGLGIHLTLDLAGRARFGPDVEWLSFPPARPLAGPAKTAAAASATASASASATATTPAAAAASAAAAAAAAAQAAEPPEFDYRVLPSRALDAGWHAAIRAYWPGLPAGDAALVPAYSGVRPKLPAPAPAGASSDRSEFSIFFNFSDFSIFSNFSDFGVQTAKSATWPGGRGHGVPGLVCLYGVESPGLTSAMALAEHVVGDLAEGG